MKSRFLPVVWHKNIVLQCIAVKCAYVYICIHMRVCIYIHTYSCNIYMHTYKHTVYTHTHNNAYTTIHIYFVDVYVYIYRLKVDR